MPRFSTEVMMRGTQPLVGGQTQCALGRRPAVSISRSFHSTLMVPFKVWSFWKCV